MSLLPFTASIRHGSGPVETDSQWRSGLSMAPRSPQSWACDIPLSAHSVQVAGSMRRFELIDAHKEQIAPLLSPQKLRIGPSCGGLSPSAERNALEPAHRCALGGSAGALRFCQHGGEPVLLIGPPGGSGFKVSAGSASAPRVAWPVEPVG